MQDPRQSSVGSYRWVVCALLFFATTVNYVDRAVLGVLEPELHKVIGWTATQYGDINSAFNLAYAIGFLFAGLDDGSDRNAVGLHDITDDLVSGGGIACVGTLGFRFCG